MEEVKNFEEHKPEGTTDMERGRRDTEKTKPRRGIKHIMDPNNEGGTQKKNHWNVRKTFSARKQAKEVSAIV